MAQHDQFPQLVLEYSMHYARILHTVASLKHIGSATDSALLDNSINIK